MTLSTSSTSEINRRLDDGGLVFLDGATGTELQRRGAPLHPVAWCAPATETHAKILCQIHRDYIDAGADVVTANTFSTSREVLQSAGLAGKFERLNRLAVELALRARDEANADRPILVAGSMAHIIPGDVNDRASQHSPTSKLEDDFGAMAELLKESGCDLILPEMMMDPVYAPIVIRAAVATGLAVWVGLSARQDDTGELVTNDAAGRRFEEVLEPIVAAGGDVFGVMHTSCGVLRPALKAIEQHWKGRLSAYPDLLSHERDGSFRKLGEMDDVRFAEYCRGWVGDGAQVIGGCCGFTISHIKSMVASLT